jgi:hypothetical protein
MRGRGEFRRFPESTAAQLRGGKLKGSLQQFESIGTPFELTQPPTETIAPPSDSDAENTTTSTGFGLRVHRLRFRIDVGDDVGSHFLLDGLSLWLRAKRLGSSASAWSEYALDPPGRYQEMGFG